MVKHWSRSYDVLASGYKIDEYDCKDVVKQPYKSKKEKDLKLIF